MSTDTTTATAIPARSDRATRERRAKASLLVFSILLIPLSLFGYWFYINFSDAPLTLPSLPLALAPGLASVITRLLRREGFADVSFRLRGPRMGSAYLLAFVLPLLVGTVAYGAAFAVGLARFDPPPFPVAVSPAIVQFGVNLLFVLTVGLLLVFPSTAGEEIGWRGFLLPRLMDARVPQANLLTALVWGAWHLPVVFAGVYAAGESRLLSAALLMLATAAVGLIFGWLRLATGSVMPCILAHAAWNAVINGAFTPAAQEGTARLWTGETGILVLLTLIPVTLFIARTWRTRVPDVGEASRV